MPWVEVISQEMIGERLFALTFVSPVKLDESSYQPGQFLHIRVSEASDLLLRRPLSLSQADVENNHVTVVYRVQGEGTKRLSQVAAGDRIDVLGPLGQGFPIHQEDRHSVLIGGGIGVPPLVELARHLCRVGQKVTSVVGFLSVAQAILLKELAQFGEVIVVTNDGTLGRQGLVTDELMPKLCAGADRFYACGPTPMLKAVQAVMRERRVPGYLSLEERMACGIGICVGCTHTILRGHVEKNVKTCTEGPVFPADEVVFS